MRTTIMHFGAALLLTGAAGAQPWATFGATSHRNGLNGSSCGPGTPTVLWRTTAAAPGFTEIAEQPLISGSAVIVTRWPSLDTTAQDCFITALNLNTGAELRRFTVSSGSSGPGSRTRAVGVFGNILYATRAGRGSTAETGDFIRTGPLVAFNLTTGAIVWASPDHVYLAPGESLAFSFDGDPITTAYEVNTGVRSLVRISRTTGARLWTTPFVEVGPGASNPALSPGSTNQAIYLWTDDPNAPRISSFSAATGALRFRSSPISDWSLSSGIELQQAGCMVGTDGRVYANRTSQTIVSLTDSGSSFTQNWQQPLGPGAYSNNATVFQNRVYFLGQDRRIKCVDRASGTLVAQSSIVFANAGTDYHFAAGECGDVYFSDGVNAGPDGPVGTITAFAPNLASVRWRIEVPGLGRGGVSIGSNVAVYTSRGHEIVALRTGPCRADYNGAGLTVQDLYDFLADWLGGYSAADYNLTGGVTVQDLYDYFEAWSAGCP